ncbi:brevican core protein-like [Amphibalanus amphitrite]|uniref:brevican core protein-like n=1 Tax=Amphibalanus amphitrite TaxID=1232801 RepID=UPI001C902C69|nr:brevican core protein-like [Amphibalanus amphitrite]
MSAALITVYIFSALCSNIAASVTKTWSIRQAGIPTYRCACPVGFSRCAGRCLTRLNQTANYSTAERLCSEINAHLFAPHTDEENQCAFTLRSGQWAWLGYSDREVEGEFVAADGCGTYPSTGVRWRPDEPDNWLGAEHCVGMIAYDEWNDRPCGDNMYPLCQLGNCPRPECP